MSDKKEFLISLLDDNGLIKFFRKKVNGKSSKFNYEADDYSNYLDEDENFKSLDKAGEINFDNEESLIILKSEVAKELTSKSSKKKQYDIAKKVLKHETFDAVILITYDNNQNFRFSLITKNYFGTKSEFNSFKRYTYFIDINKPNKTFVNQIEKAEFSSIENVKEAFSIEPLNKEFYQQIASSFYNLVGGKLKINNKTKEYNSVLQLPEYDINENRKVYQEFAVRLIGRTIFIWFLKNKKSNNNLSLIPESWLTLDKVEETESYYHNLLEKLFFDILNKDVKDRKENLPKEHITIPFLNGGLFEPQNHDFYDNNQFNGRLSIPNKWFIELFTTLEQFNFTIDENSLSDQEVSIDPEMLGTIFENLLAEIDPDTEKSARKSTGSFYTPREIVDYMVEESLVAYLSNKTKIKENILHDLFKENDFLAEHFENPIKLIDAFDELKILDPACGSGAFPMGALHKINIALQKLDPDSEIWKQKQLSKIDNSAFRQILKNKLDNSNVDYIRKLGIIQHSIYGVDIQTIATEISKLRSFLSLIVDEHIDDNAENRGILPLPNLEFKFVTANTLISLEKKKKSGFDFGAVDNDIENLKRIRKEYLQSSGVDKVKLKEEFLNIQNEIAEKEQKNETLGLNKRSFQIASWKPFGHESNDWFDSELMFGVKGFDVVVGNPPYIQLSKVEGISDTYKEYLRLEYGTSGGRLNTFIFFIHKGLTLLNNSSILTYIIPNTILTQEYYSYTREELLKNNFLYKVINYSNMPFANAVVENITLMVKNDNLKDYDIQFYEDNLKLIKLLTKKNSSTFINERFYALNYNVDKIIEKISTKFTQKLNDLCFVNQGIALKGDRQKLLREENVEGHYYKVLDGRNINKYSIDWSGIYLDYKLDYIHSCKRKDIFESNEKLMFRRVSSDLVFTYDNSQYFTLNTIVLVNKKNENVNLKFLLVILNSSIINYFYKLKYKSTKKVFSEIQAGSIKYIPIPKTSLDQEKPFEELADIIIQKKENNEDTTKEELKADIMVYKLYELTYDEVLIVDSEFGLSREEYEGFNGDL